MYNFFFGHTAQHVGILVPQPGIEPVPPAVEAWSLNHWTTREAPDVQLFELSEISLLRKISVFVSLNIPLFYSYFWKKFKTEHGIAFGLL